MKIEKVRLQDIQPYSNNAKKHPQSQIEQIKRSIQEFGNNDPIAVDENGVIIEGHGRYEALKQLGYEEAEIIRLKGLSEQQKKAYILVHNKLTMNTGFDSKILAEELETIQGLDLGVFDLYIPCEFTATQEEITVQPQPALELIKFTLTLSEEQYQTLILATEQIDYSVPKGELHAFGNPNKRNNLIFEVIYQWAEQKKLL